MHSIQIWRALPEEISLDNLIGDISLTTGSPPSPWRLGVIVRQPTRLAGELHHIPGGFDLGLPMQMARLHVLEVALLLNRGCGMNPTEPMLDADTGSHALTLKVFDCANEPRELAQELAQLTIAPRTNDPFLCDAAWSPMRNGAWSRAGADINQVLTARFLPYPVSPWTVLRAVTNLLHCGICGDGVVAFHHSMFDDITALPCESGLR